MEAIRKVLQEGDEYDLPTDGAECLIEVIEDADCFFPEKEVSTQSSARFTTPHSQPCVNPTLRSVNEAHKGHGAAYF